MKIKVICKLYDADAKYFLEPLKHIFQRNSLILYRDQMIPDEFDIKQITPIVSRFSLISNFIRFFQIILSKNKPDLIIGFYEIPHGIIALLTSKFLNVYSVVCIIGNPKINFRNKGIRGRVTNWIYKNTDVITVTGNISKKYLLENKKIKSDKIFILPNSIIDNTFYSLDIKPKYDLITLGRLSSEKGLFNLLNLVKELKLKIPNVKLGIAGKGPLYHSLQKEIGKLDLDNNVDLLGYINDANQYLNNGKIFISTSFTEGLPRTIIQSMFCGTPVISLDVGDISDLIIDEYNGYIINPPYESNIFTNKVFKLLNDEKLRKIFSKNCISHVSKLYSNENAMNVWLEILKYLKINNK